MRSGEKSSISCRAFDRVLMYSGPSIPPARGKFMLNPSPESEPISQEFPLNPGIEILRITMYRDIENSIIVVEDFLSTVPMVKV